jgi:hypothetical protein
MQAGSWGMKISPPSIVFTAESMSFTAWRIVITNRVISGSVNVFTSWFSQTVRTLSREYRTFPYGTTLEKQPRGAE